MYIFSPENVFYLTKEKKKLQKSILTLGFQRIETETEKVTPLSQCRGTWRPGKMETKLNLLEILQKGNHLT